VSPDRSHVEFTVGLESLVSGTRARHAHEGRASTVAHGSIGVHGQTSYIEMSVVIQNNFSLENFQNDLASGNR